MESGKKTLPLQMEIENLRQNLKMSNHETVEECQRLRSEIQKLYFQIARITRPGRYAGKESKTKDRSPENHTVVPEVIPPGLDVDEYLNSRREVAVSREQKNEEQPLPPLDPLPRTLRERDATIEQRFNMVAERMKERRRRWLEERDKRKPWWNKLGL